MLKARIRNGLQRGAALLDDHGLVRLEDLEPRLRVRGFEQLSDADSPPLERMGRATGPPSTATA
jgi:hypothetical protein